jgi:hypothetical protein
MFHPRCEAGHLEFAEALSGFGKQRRNVSTWQKTHFALDFLALFESLLPLEFLSQLLQVLLILVSGPVLGRLVVVAPSNATLTSITPSCTRRQPVRPSLRYSAWARSRISWSSESSKRARCRARRSPVGISGSKWGGTLGCSDNPDGRAKGSSWFNVVDRLRASGQDIRERQYAARKVE